MGDILSALKVGDLLMQENLTWQAIAILIVLIAFGVAVVACAIGQAVCLAGKAVKIWRDALK